jgi:hypothetical protein
MRTYNQAIELGCGCRLAVSIYIWVGVHQLDARVLHDDHGHDWMVHLRTSRSGIIEHQSGMTKMIKIETKCMILFTSFNQTQLLWNLSSKTT